MPRRENEERKSTFLFRDYRLYGYSASAKCNRNLLLPSLIRTLAALKILPLGNAQINLTLPSLNRTLADAEDTPTRQLQINLHCARLIRIFDCVLDTRARQYSNKFDIALAYSYLCSGSGGAAGERQRSRSEPDRKSDER